MENQTPDTPHQEEEGALVYIIGAIIVVAIIVAAVIMWPKPKQSSQTNTPVAETNTTPKPKAPLTALVCENEWFNPVIGLPKYYLSAEGGDVSKGENITCTFQIIKGKEPVITETMTVPVAQSPERGGTTFKCTTKALEHIPQNIPVEFTTIVKNEAGQTASCSGTVTFR